MAIAIKQAVEAAKRTCMDLFEQERGVLLEEVETKDDRWYITLSFPRRAEEDPLKPLAGVFGPRLRAFKIFVVNRESGEVESIKIRELNERAA